MPIEYVAPARMSPADLRVFTRAAIDDGSGPFFPGWTAARCIVARTVPAVFGELPTVCYLCLDGTWRKQDACRMAQTARLPDGVELDAAGFTAETTDGEPLARLAISDARTPPPCGDFECEGLRRV